MADAAVAPHLSLDEYFALERESEERHEYLDGEVFAMGGASWTHGQLGGNLFFALRQRLPAGCFLQSSDQRVLVSKTGLYTYPDLVALCEPPRFQDATNPDTLLNPRVIIEILSPSTEAYDRTTKFDHYRTIPSLREYLLVAQDERRVHRYLRQGETSRWEFVELTGDEILDIASVGVEVPLSEIYDGILRDDAMPSDVVANSDPSTA